ncbi:MAG: RNA methyltransferase, partial [Gammaproteobacteria bacterium]
AELFLLCGACVVLVADLFTTARSRHIGWPTLSPREAAEAIAADAAPAALVFGREATGLSNEELDRCQHAISIPTAPDYRSLNLAQAVQICAYELRVAHALPRSPPEAKPARSGEAPASAEALEQLREHCLAVMQRVGYYDPAKPKLLERRLRRMISGAGMRHSEVQILRGLLGAVEARLDEHEK